MATADELRRILRTEYGISSDAELLDAMQDMTKVNISLFVACEKKVKTDNNFAGPEQPE